MTFAVGVFVCVCVWTAPHTYALMLPIRAAIAKAFCVHTKCVISVDFPSLDHQNVCAPF